jgi:ParB-like chromosome segregation protein Spo0J
MSDMQMERVNPKRLVAAAYNPRKIKPEEMESLRRSIREFGLVQPIVVQMPGNRIIGGHQRVEAAIAEGLKKVAVIRLRISDARAQALNLALNRISGEWDDAKLADLLRVMEEPDLASTGFDAEEIADLLDDSLEGRTVEEISPQAAPQVTWYLLAIPRAKEAEVAPHLEALEAAAEVRVQSSHLAGGKR